MARYTLLIADDDEYVCEDVATSLNCERYEVDTTTSGENAFELFQQKRYQIVITDLQMKKTRDDGFVLLEKIQAISPQTAVMIITSHGDLQRAVKAMQLGAVDFVTKPYEPEQIIARIDKIAERIDLQEENSRLRTALSSQYSLVGDSVFMQELRQQIDHIARTDSRVLIVGPNGSGKEVVASSIHTVSKRAGKPFIAVNCAAIPDNLIESELFGTNKGAFTGSIDKKGQFELAAGGTIFLDEIGDMSLKTQAKVLRILQEGKFERVGGTRTIEVDVRVIAASSKVLEDEIREGTFREDLFYRLNVVPFHIQPLRERKEDIPVLAEHFLDLFCRREGREIKVMAAEALAMMKSYDWPGNVRELKNIIERLVIMTPGRTITDAHMPGHLAGKDAREEGGARLDSLRDASSLREAREEFEKEFIIQKLEENDWNISKTAEAIELERSNLHRKIKSYGINLRK